MRVMIKGKEVLFDDGKGSVIVITTDQLLEMVGLLNTTILDGDRFYFVNLEFTV